MLGQGGMRIGDDHRIFHVFGCGDGYLLGRLPTKESVKRQRVVPDEHPEPRGSELSKEGRAQVQSGVSPWGEAQSFPLKWVQVLHWVRPPESGPGRWHATRL